MQIKIQPHAGIPVYKQMVNSIIAAIECGELGVGEKLPSIRGLSNRLNVNPNTTAKVYRELELRGVIQSRVGSGSFVLPQSDKAVAAVKQARMQELFNKIVNEAEALSISEQEIVQFLRLRADS